MTPAVPEAMTAQEILRLSGLRRDDFEWVPEALPREALLKWVGTVALALSALATLFAAPNPWWLVAGPMGVALLFLSLGEVAASVGLVATCGLWCWQVWLAATHAPLGVLVLVGLLTVAAGLTWATATLWRRRARRKMGVEALGRLLTDIELYNREVRSFRAVQALAKAQGEHGAELAEREGLAQGLWQARAALVRSLQIDRVMREHRDILGDVPLPGRTRGTMEAIAIGPRQPADGGGALVPHAQAHAAGLLV
jgi:hypothetical protein